MGLRSRPNLAKYVLIEVRIGAREDHFVVENARSSIYATVLWDVKVCKNGSRGKKREQQGKRGNGREKEGTAGNKRERQEKRGNGGEKEGMVGKKWKREAGPTLARR